MGSECWGFNLLHMNGPIYGVLVLEIQAFTYEWSNVWGLSAGDPTFYILMVQCMGSPSTQTPYIGPLICKGLNPQHSDPIHWTINM
jgi:hypothetical protein